MPDARNEDVQNIYEILAKPAECLLQHMTNVGVLAHVMLTQSVLHSALVKLAKMTESKSKKDTLDFLTYIFAMHDVGKAHPEFQKNIRNQNKHAGDFRHEVYGARVLKKILKSKGMKTRMTMLTAEIIKNHHQKSGNGENPDDEEYWSKIQHDNEKIINEHFPFDINITVKKECENKFGHLALGCLICCDWLASGDLVFKSMPDIHNYDNYLSVARLRAEDFVMRSGLENRKLPYANFKKMFPFIKKPTPVQKIIFEHRGKTLFQIIESPMGSGKSEAAFYAAFHTGVPCTGIIECMPTNATSIAMKPRIDAIMHELDLENSFRVGGLQKLDAPEKEVKNLWEAARAMKLSAPYIIGTIDQMLRCIRAVRYSDLQLVFVQAHAVILDEVHSYDPLTVNIIEAFLKFAKAYEIPVIMMTATLPDALKKRFISVYSSDFSVSSGRYPLITSFDSDRKKIIEEFPKKKPENYEIVFKQIHGIYDNCNKIAEKALDLVKEGGCCSVVLNTVERAVRTAYELKKINTDIEIYLVHGRMTKKQKDEKVEKIVSIVGSSETARRHRPKKAVFVSTQIIELSVDADFDFMLSDLAPIDTLFQRSGRLWRSSKSGTIRDAIKIKRTLFVLIPDDLKKCYPYRKGIVENTLKTMKKTYLMPSKIKCSLNDVYTESVIKELLDEKKLKAKIGCQSIEKEKFSIDEKTLNRNNQNVREGQETWKIAFANEETVSKAEKDLNEAMKFMEHFVVSVVEKEKPEGKEMDGYLKGIVLIDKNDPKFRFSNFYGCYKREWIES